MFNKILIRQKRKIPILSTPSKLEHLWKSYEDSLQHVFHLNKNVHPKTNVHVSRTNSLVIPIMIALGAGGMSVILSLLLVRLPLFTQYHEQESTLSTYQHLSFLLVYYSLYLAVAITALALKNLTFKILKQSTDLLILFGLNIIILPLSLLHSFQPIMLIVNFAFCLLLVVVGKISFKHYTYAGINFYLATCIGTLIGSAWGIEFFLSMDASAMTKGLLLITVPPLLLALPSGFLRMLELYDVVCRDNWQRPRNPFPESWAMNEPFVSIHVPTYSEPPELVIETLDKLAAVDYRNYEVIVIDNNTKDPNLWLPVSAHCTKLGEKFRFMHVDNIEGAKGGALNYIHKYIDPRTTIIGVIDADYQVDKGFLKALVGHFNDPKVGFVQTPHDYRAWRDNLFLTMCYWEYKIFFHSVMISLNERGAGITVGTMCLVRKEALEKAGGWSEWCVTEDSELAIRIHDVGYSSIYVDKTYGRGLIPDSFEGYKKQRYRWTAGPVQEFRYYAKHFIGLSQKESKFSFMQRIFHLNHGLGAFLNAFNIPLIFIGMALVTSMILHHEIIAVPFALWITATVTLLASPLLVMVMYRATVNATFSEIIGQAVAAKALSHVVFYASLRTAITRSAAWNRTNKFKSTQSYMSALMSTKEELLIGLSLITFVVGAYIAFPYQGLSLMLLIGISYVSLDYFAAPLMAVIGTWSFKRETRHAKKHTLNV